MLGAFDRSDLHAVHVLVVRELGGAVPQDLVALEGAHVLVDLLEHEAKSPEFKKIYEDMRAFQRDQILWNRASEFPYNQYMNGVKI